MIDADLSRRLARIDRIRREIATRWFWIGAGFATGVYFVLALWVRAGGQP